jgi:hypothetical protein
MCHKFHSAFRQTADQFSEHGANTGSYAHGVGVGCGRQAAPYYDAWCLHQHAMREGAADVDSDA